MNRVHARNLRRADARRLRLSMELLDQRHLLAGDLNWFTSFESVPRLEASQLAASEQVESDLMGPRERIASEWIVQLSDSASQTLGAIDDAASLLLGSAADFKVISGLGSAGALLVRGLGVETVDVRDSLSRSPSVVSFSQNQVITGQATTPNESDFAAGLLSGLQTIGGEDAWDVGRGDSQIVVGVLDTGIDPTHPDLYLNLWLNQGEIPPTLVDGEGGDLVDIDGDGLITFYDLNNVTVGETAPYVLTFGGWETGPNASLVSDLNANGYVDAKDLLEDTLWADGRDNDGNGFFDDLFGVNFRAGTDDPLAPNDPSDLLGHGTHVAGTIGAIGNNGQGVVGVNWRTSLMSLRILDNNNQGDTGAALRAINYARQMRGDLETNGAGRVVSGANVRVLNNSWGQPGGYEPSVEQAIETLDVEEVLFVAAAGNGNILGQGVDNDRTPFYPASYDVRNVIAVAASNFEDELASFSNFGAESVDVAAPGVAVRSTLPGGLYGSANGTSMATPHVAGTAALVWSVSPEATLEEIRESILNTTSPLASGRDVIRSQGRVDASAAIDAEVFAPAARMLSADSVTIAGGTTTEFSVEYFHRLGIDAETLGDDDLTVTRQWGPAVDVDVALKPGSVEAASGVVTATYVVTAPGGDWDPLDFGEYLIRTRPGGVATVNGQLTEARDVGQFLVRVEDPTVIYASLRSDSNDPGSLREAIRRANSAGAQRTIILESGRYTIDIPAVPDPAYGFYHPPAYCASWDLQGDDWSNEQTGDFDITGDIIIAGDTMEESVIDAQSFDRVFKVHEGASLQLHRITVTGGLAPASQGGGGILSAGDLSLWDTVVRDNRAASRSVTNPLRGGGIASWNGSVNVYRSWIARNEAEFGGGMFYCNSASGEVSASTFEANQGGGLHSHSDHEIRVVNSTFSGNIGGQGAIFNGKSADGLEEVWGAVTPQMSSDGRYIAFAREPGRFSDVPQTIGVRDMVTDYQEYVSTTVDGDFPDGDSFSPWISSTGRFVVYESDATNLLPGDTNGSRDVFLYDRDTNQTELISRTADGISANGESTSGAVSADGRYVVFASSASNLVPNDNNDVIDIFVRDRQLGVTERVSVADDGTEADQESVSPSISDDGRYVAFSSDASTLSPPDDDKASDAFIFDRQAQTIRRVQGAPSLQLSGDGDSLVFSSNITSIYPIEEQIASFGGGAAGFDGVDDAITIADAPELRSSAFTIELTAILDSRTIEDGDALLVKSSGANWSDGYGLYYDSGRIHFFVSGQANRISAPVRLDRISHFVGTYDGSVIRLFVDGEEQAALELAGPPVQSAADLIIGASPGGQRFFGGTLDEVAIYDSVLGGTEIAEHADGLGLQSSPIINDDFADAIDLGDRGYHRVRFTNAGASAEVGEPSQSGLVNSVWWKWTAPTDGRLKVGQLYGALLKRFDTVVTIAVGSSVDQLTVLAQDDDGGPNEGYSLATTPVVAGQEYYIAVDGFDAIESTGDLDLEFEPSNRGSGNSINLGSETSVATRGYSAGGLLGGLYWGFAPGWGWTAPGDGVLVVQTDTSELLGVRVGTLMDGQYFVLKSTEDGHRDTAFPNAVTLPVTAGTQYDVRVAHEGGIDFGSFYDLSLEFIDTSIDAGNDAFDSAVDLGTATQISAEGWNVGYTSEPSELAQSDETHSAWWKWTAPTNGMLMVDSVGSRFDTFLTIAQGDAVGELTVVAADEEDPHYLSPPRYPETHPDRLAAIVNAGEEYFIAVDGLEDAQGAIQLNLNLKPINDDFGERVDLGSAISIEATGTNVGFTSEPGEVLQDGAIASAWWSWTAPEDGVLFVETEGSEINPMLTVATGDAVSELTVLAQQQRYHNNPPSPLAIRVDAGIQYQIAVDGFRRDGDSVHFDEGAYRIGLEFEARATRLGNDFFRDRIDLGAVTTATFSGNHTGYLGEYASPYYQDAWWSWTAPDDGVLFLETLDSPIFVEYGVYTGSERNSLQEVSGTRTFPVVAGTEYQISVGKSMYSDPEEFTASLRWQPFATNDEYSTRLDLGSVAQTTITGTNVPPDSEPGESHLRWHEWRAPSDGTLYLDGTSDSFILSVAELIGDDIYPLQLQSTSFRPPVISQTVATGQRILITIVGRNGHTGAYEFDLEFFPDNDDFADRIDLGSATQVQTTGHSWEGYSGEPFEFQTADSQFQTAWWQWTAPADGALEVKASSDRTDSYSILSILTGNQLGLLTRVARGEASYVNEPRYTAHAVTAVTSGETYNIAVDLLDYQLSDYYQPPILLDLSFVPEADNSNATNNAFEHAEELGDVLSTQIIGSNIGFTNQPGEPSQSGDAHSAWYSWTAPVDGTVQLSSEGGFDPFLTIARGTSLATLNVVRQGVASVSASVEAGQTYLIAIDGEGLSQGNFEVNLDLRPAAGRNRFSDRVDLGFVRNVVIDANNGGFSGEFGEPSFSGTVRSAWYTWTAPGDGRLSLQVNRGNDRLLDPVVSVSRGDSVDQLTVLGWNDDAEPSNIDSYLEIPVTQGSAYQIAVDGFGNSSGDYTFELQFDRGDIADRINSARPAAYWRFESPLDSEVEDASGNGNHGAATGDLDSRLPGLIHGDVVETNTVYVYDRPSGQVTPFSLERAGLGRSSNNYAPAVSSDGRFLVFASSSIKDAGRQSSGEEWGTFLIDLDQGGVTELPTVYPNDYNDLPLDISDDGRYVLVETECSCFSYQREYSLIDTVDGGVTGIKPTPETAISRLDVRRSTIAYTEDAELAVGGRTALKDVLFAGNRVFRDHEFAVENGNVISSLDPGADRLGGLVRFEDGVPVHPILRGNPAIDSGDSTLGIPLDQRGETRIDPDIGAFEATTAAITGKLFLDTNGNQVRDRDESGIADALVTVSGFKGSVSGVSASDDPFTLQVDESGSFVIDELPSGDYRVSVQGIPNWSVSQPGLSQFPDQALEPNASISGRIAADGRFIVFTSRATNIHPDDLDSQQDVFLFDRQDGTTELITDEDRLGSHAAISADGQTILYDRSTFGTGIMQVYDRVADQHYNVASADKLTSDGRYAYSGMTFIDFRASTSFTLTNVIPADIQGVDLVGYSTHGPEIIFTGRSLNQNDETLLGIYSYNLATEETAAFYSEVANSDETIEVTWASGRGDFLTFRSPANGAQQSLFDRHAGITVEDPWPGAPADSGTITDADGRYVIDATTYFPPDGGITFDSLRVRDRATDVTRLVPLAHLGIRGSWEADQGSVSGDGRLITIGRYLIPNPFDPDIRIGVEIGDLLADLNLGLVPDPGLISGSIFEDVAPNGVRDVGEPPISSWRVFLDINGNGIADEGEPFEITDLSGFYQFEEVDAFRDYTVRAEPAEGFTLVGPGPQSDFSWNIFLPAGAEITDRDFVVRRVVNTPQSTNSSVGGRIFDDVNGNETFDPGIDRPHDDVRVYLDANNDRQHNPGTNEPITRTDADGRYLFEGLGSRIVSVSTILDGGTVHASPLGNSYRQETYPLFPGIQPFASPQAIDIGDFNGDGHGDVAVLLSERNEIAIRLNDGQGGFDAGGFEIDLGSAGSGPVAMFVGQFNGSESRPDIAIAGQFSSDAVVLLDVDAVAETVGAQTTFAVGDEPTDLTAADLTGDGHLDLVVAGKGSPGAGSISVLVNRGDGAFVVSEPIATGGRFAVGVIAGEFTGDAHVDVAVAHASPSSPTSPHGDVRVLAGDGQGNLSYDGNRYEVGALPTDLLTSDFNGDGLADLAVANFASNTVSVLSGAFESGDGGPTVFRDEEVILGTASGAIDIAIGDMDGDGDVDILASNLTDRNISIFRNVSTQEQSRFEPLQNIGLGQFAFAQRMPLVAVNVDGDFGGVDGTVDIIAIPRLTDTIHVLRNELIDGSHRVRLDGLNDVTGLDFLTRPALVAPTLDPISDPAAMDEDDGTINIPLQGISKGRGDGPDLRITATSSHPGVIAHPVVDYVAGASSGSLSVTPIQDANTEQSPVTIVVEARNAGANETFGDEDDGVIRQSFTVTVTPVNDPPTFDLQPLVSVTQKGGATVVQSFASGMAPGGANDEASQILTEFLVVSGDPSLFLEVPTLDETGRLRFTPDPNKSGVTLVSVSLSDDGGTEAGGSDTTTKSFVINVTAVNDRPSILLAGDLMVAPDAGPRTEVSFATEFHPGVGDDDAIQVLTDFILSTDQPELFSVLPDIDNDGTLTFTPQLGALGTATVTVQVRDSGDLSDGGQDTSLPQTFTITVGNVDLPEVESVAINEGSVERSQVTSLTVNFSAEVDHAKLADAFTLTNIDTNQVVGTIHVAASDSGGKTSAMLTFSGASTVARGVGNSLANGNYRLDIDAEKVTSPGGASAMAEDYRFGGQTKSEPENDDFFRMYGDLDGDGDVDGLDYAALGATFLRQSGDASYNAALDNDGDGDVDGIDYADFGEQFLRQRR